MKVRHHVAIVLALSAAAFGSAYWQASVAPADSEAGRPRASFAPCTSVPAMAEVGVERRDGVAVSR